MVQSNCQDCPNRHMGCHSTCESYIAYRKAKDAENKALYSERQKRYADKIYREQKFKRLKRYSCV